MKDLAALEKKNTGDSVQLNLGASITLAVQMKPGAPLDGCATTQSKPPHSS